MKFHDQWDFRQTGRRLRSFSLKFRTLEQLETYLCMAAPKDVANPLWELAAT
jgi:hypothetical protein